MANPTGAVRITVTRASGLVDNYGVANDTLVGFIETKDLDGGSAFNKVLQAIILHLTYYRELSFMTLVIKGRQNRSDTLEELGRFRIRNEDPVYFIQDIPQMRYYRLRLEDSPITQQWRLSGMDIFGKPGSKRL